ncbi:cytochrome c biogenesis protein ResB [Acidobacteriota bacterium]
MRFFSSVKLAIVLLIIITIASILGTLIPQHRSTAEYAALYGQFSTVLVRLEITKLYQAWWFIGLLFLFSLNIIVCTLTRLSPKLKRALKPSMVKEKKRILSLKIQAEFNKNKDLETTASQTKKELASRRYRVTEERQENNVFFLGRKRMLGLFGSDIVHLGLLVIIIGGIVSSFAGFRTNMNIAEGQTMAVPQADFQLRLDKFETELYPNGNVRDWKSTLSVIEEDKVLFDKTIEVNHPLSYKGFVFYQARVGYNWENPILHLGVTKSADPSFLKQLKLRVGETARLEEENIDITVIRFVPDFIIGEKNEVATRSMNPNNPAVLIGGRRDGEEVFSAWAFAKYPDFGQMHSKQEHDLKFELTNFEAAQYSGLQVARDPGVNLIWIGCAFLMIGLCIAFFWPPREIKVILEKSDGKTDIVAGGIATKNKEDFQAEFDKMMESLRRSK